MREIKARQEREIKFRAWEYRGGYSGNMMIQREVDNDGEIFWGLRDGKLHYDFDSIMEEECFIVMQYTGLRDKNGNEIYEGDVVGPQIMYGSLDGKHEINLEVFWDEYKWRLRATHVVPGCIRWDQSIGDVGEMEVIGNIYENPTLLGKENPELLEEK